MNLLHWNWWLDYKPKIGFNLLEWWDPCEDEKWKKLGFCTEATESKIINFNCDKVMKSITTIQAFTLNSFKSIGDFIPRKPIHQILGLGVCFTNWVIFTRKSCPHNFLLLLGSASHWHTLMEFFPIKSNLLFIFDFIILSVTVYC